MSIRQIKGLAVTGYIILLLYLLCFIFLTARDILDSKEEYDRLTCQATRYVECQQNLLGQLDTVNNAIEDAFFYQASLPELTQHIDLVKTSLAKTHILTSENAPAAWALPALLERQNMLCLQYIAGQPDTEEARQSMEEYTELRQALTQAENEINLAFSTEIQRMEQNARERLSERMSMVVLRGVITFLAIAAISCLLARLFSQFNTCPRKQQ